jgi:NO-binding membrane sensor protein with MHYT domain
MRTFINATLLGAAIAAVDYTKMGANWTDSDCVNGKE